MFSNEDSFIVDRTETKEYIFPVLADPLEVSNDGTGFSESLIEEIKFHLLYYKEEI
jgi:hypothetical protein